MSATILELEARVKALEQRLGVNNQIDAKLAGLLNLVALQCGISVHAIQGTRRPDNIVQARRIFCYLAHCMGKTYPAIAFSIRPTMHHSTVMSACAVCEDRMDQDSGFRNEVRVLARTASITLPERYQS
jgi:chromosomal replication initiation ATPase DnaA